MSIPSCRDVAQAVSRGDYYEGPWWNRIRLRLHVFVCYICRRYIAQIKFVNRGVREISKSRPKPQEVADLKSRLIGRLEKPQ